MKYFLACMCFILTASLCLKAQDDYNAPNGLNNWYVELGGSAFFYSINYEKYLYRNGMENFTWVGRVGAGFNPIEYNFLNSLFLERNTFIFPFTSTVFIGKGKEKLELGGGFTMLTRDFFNQEVVPTINAGVRVMESNGVCFRVTYTPLIRTNNLVHWIGVSIGRNFNFK